MPAADGKRAFKLKQRHSELAGDDFDALVIYLQSLRLGCVNKLVCEQLLSTRV